MNTIPSSATPQLITLVMAGLRSLLMLLGGAGIVTAHFTDEQLLPIASACVTIGGFVWVIYEQFRQQRMRHAAATASATALVPVQRVDYSRS